MKIKSSLKKILLSTLASISIIHAADNDPTGTGRPGQHEISLTIPASDLRLAMENRFPSLLSGSRDISRLPLALLRDITQKVNSEAMVIQPKAGPIFAWMKNEIQAMVPQFPKLQFLVSELQDSINRQHFDFTVLFGYGFRTLGAISGTPTPDALAVFSGFDADTIDRDIRKNWKSPYSIFPVTEQDSLNGNGVPTILNPRLVTRIQEEADRISRVTVSSFSLFGRGKLGLATLINCFINRMYPMPVTSQGLTAHGIPMTPFLFGFHDYLHAKIDTIKRGNVFESAIYALFEKAAINKIDVDDLIEPVARSMVDRSNLTEDTLSQLLDLYFTYYLPTHRMSDLKKALVGFFVTVHEDLNINPDIFRTYNFDDILKLLTSEMDLIDTSDILSTDPVTGKTSLNAEQALDAILADGEPPIELRNTDGTYRFKRSDLAGRKYRIDITETPMMTTVKVKIAGGTEYTWNIETLKYALASALDEVGLLKIAGITMTPPTQEELSSENGRAIALAYLDKVSNAIRECQSFFKATASELLGHVPAGQTKSLWQKFWDKTKKIDKKFATEVAAID